MFEACSAVGERCRRRRPCGAARGSGPCSQSLGGSRNSLGIPQASKPTSPNEVEPRKRRRPRRAAAPRGPAAILEQRGRDPGGGLEGARPRVDALPSHAGSASPCVTAPQRSLRRVAPGANAAPHHTPRRFTDRITSFAVHRSLRGLDFRLASPPASLHSIRSPRRFTQPGLLANNKSRLFCIGDPAEFVGVRGRRERPNLQRSMRSLCSIPQEGTGRPGRDLHGAVDLDGRLLHRLHRVRVEPPPRPERGRRLRRRRRREFTRAGRRADGKGSTPPSARSV